MPDAPTPDQPDADRPRTLVRATTPRGEVALRERDTPAGTVHELVVAGVFAMDTVDTSTETELARRSLALVDRPARVLVGGLGLGFTALAVLKDRRVARLDVVEIESDLVTWARLRLTPTLGLVAGHPRAHLHAGDVAEVLRAGDGGPWDLVLLDVDNGPSFLVHAGNAGLYDDSGLRSALGALAPGGVLAIWAAQREPELLTRLGSLAPTEEVVLPVAREGRSFEYALYVARAASAAS